MSTPFIVSFHWCFCASYLGENADNGGYHDDSDIGAFYDGGDMYDDDDGPVIEELQEDDDGREELDEDVTY